jgi:hypothetical protein
VRLRLTAVLAVVVFLAASTFFVADSPYVPNVEREANPFAPERPDTLDRDAVQTYLVDYERTRLSNDLVSSRGHTLDRDDDVRADCTPVDTTETAPDQFRVRLRCRGSIDDVYRLVQPTAVSYTVTYSMDETGLSQVAISGYPFSPRDELRPPPWDS